MTAWADDILHYWFDHLGPDRWWSPTPEIDAEIRDRFESLWQSLSRERAIFFVANAREALAAVILFDQFPRNMFRKEADAFASDPLALAISRLALEAGFDQGMTIDERAFLYMPFMHSERLEDQDRSVELFDALGVTENLRFAILHRDIIRRFGRFPHRNAVLGRETLPEEADEVAEGSNW